VQQLIDRIIQFSMTRENVQDLLERAINGTLDQAFVTIVRNRIQHGGCLAQGAGMLRSGEKGKGVASRWYPQTIARRIQDLQTVRDSITFLCQDGVQFLAATAHRAEAVFFIDPPYWVAGPRLYDYSLLDHRHLFDIAQQIRGDFLMTYDDTPEIRQYAAEHGFATRLISMQNKNHVTKEELLIGRNLDWLDG
jgi:DNA adenine methylase